ncbi:MAG: hypothetical protein U0L67_08160 [Paludibacteraceae bacterium]|nr:hypothetical protein [Paludibacteraceae bacterium]
MANLYVFAIGGTGSRVLRSLTMLLAAGVKCEHNIVPIIIDPDDSAADLTRASELMKKYASIRNKLSFTDNVENRFFQTEIKQIVPNFRLPLSNTRDVEFKDYMGFDSMSEANRAFLSVLFSNDNMTADMKVGFKGNPNIGSVVLNQISDSKEFIEFANNFKQGDKIFIVSSIFGGTGASGFPLLLKTLRSNKALPMFALINDANIGACTVLPYFGVVQDDNSAIDSSTFISKAKAALEYYNKNISGNNSIDYLYYIGDAKRTNYENSEGGTTQSNDAHWVELCAALAILDFDGLSKPDFTVHKEYGIEQDVTEITFSQLCGKTKSKIQRPLIQLYLFYKHFVEKCLNEKEYLKQPWGKDNGYQESFFASDFVESLQNFFLNKQNQEEKKRNYSFSRWLEEITSNDRKFKPFILEGDDPIQSVEGFAVKYSFFGSKSYSLITGILNDKAKDIKARENSQEQKLLDLYFSTTAKVVEEKMNIH